MKLDEMLRGVPTPAPVPSVPVTGLQYDSRKLSRGEVFFAFPGERVDGHQFIPQAVEKGAAAIVSERPPDAGIQARWVQVRHDREAMALAALNFYGHPDCRPALTGVTGTNGKTTTVYLVDSILRAAGFSTGFFGTVEQVVAGQQRATVNTTPESLDVVRLFAELVEQGGSHVTFEV